VLGLGRMGRVHGHGQPCIDVWLVRRTPTASPTRASDLIGFVWKVVISKHASSGLTIWCSCDADGR
jgi:hypothetical protein